MSNPFLDTTTAIEHLPTATRTKLRSTQILTSISQIVSELLQNSLDADARHIEIGVDCEEWSCWVRDDGVGMSKDTMNLLGKGPEDGRYVTSKAYTPGSLDTLTTFGFRGEALASAANLSCVEISSRTSRSRESWSLILKGAATLYNGPSIRWRRESPGTVVSIRDAFYNLPIRRLSHPPPTRTLEQIRREIEAYALVFPSVAFSLENTNESRERNSSKRHFLKIPKTTSSLTAFRHLYGRALVENVDEVSESLDDIKLEGFISLQGAHSKEYQFIYVNRHPLSTCDLHRIIDIQFIASTFMKNAYDEIGEPGLPRSNVRRSPRRMERKPVYVLGFCIPPRHIDNCLEPSKATVHLQNKDTVTSLLISVVQSFLVRHGFLTQEHLDRKRIRDAESPSPSKRKKGKNLLSDSSPEHDLQLPFMEQEESDSREELYICDEDLADSDDRELTWKDPRTGEYFIIDKRTGNSYPRDTPSNIHENDSQPNGSLPESSRRRTIPIRNTGEIGTSIPMWIQAALAENQAYTLTEPKIPSLPISSALTSDTSSHNCGDHRRESHRYRPGLYSAKQGSHTQQFRKDDLIRAEIINQVDRKFIACLIDGDSGDPDHPTDGRALVLIDQHAADERVRVERFLKDLCLGFLRRDHEQKGKNGVQTKDLSPPVAILLTRHEAHRLKNSEDMQRAFSSWGIRFMNLSQVAEQDLEDGMDTDSSNGYVQVLVHSIPEVVSEKLLTGDELRELVKGFIAKLETDTSYTSATQDVGEDGSVANDELAWFTALRWCPRELLDLVNSKACRGAIMFNDSLTMEQCERLVQQLSETVFPFQCAHGRPSMVPVANVCSRRDGGRHGSNIEWTRFERKKLVRGP